MLYCIMNGTIIVWLYSSLLWNFIGMELSWLILEPISITVSILKFLVLLEDRITFADLVGLEMDTLMVLLTSSKYITRYWVINNTNVWLISVINIVIVVKPALIIAWIVKLIELGLSVLALTSIGILELPVVKLLLIVDALLILLKIRIALEFVLAL